MIKKYIVHVLQALLHLLFYILHFQIFYISKKVKKVSIIIVTYNGKKWIKKCIASCLASDYPVDIIVVDNGSTDETLDLLPKDSIHLCALNHNLGFGPANNLGMVLAFEELGADYVFLLNQDAYISTDAIGELVKCHQQYPDLGLISPMHYDGLDKEFDYRFKIYYGRSKPCKEHEGLRTVKFVNAAAWFLPKATIMKVGGFDPIFSHTGEDDNLCQRIRHRKLPIVIAEKSRIQHDRQNRVKPSTPPYLRIPTRARIIVFNPAMNILFKFGLLLVLAGEYCLNFYHLKEYRTRDKLRSDRQTLKDIWGYARRYRKIYKEKGVFLPLSENKK